MSSLLNCGRKGREVAYHPEVFTKLGAGVTIGAAALGITALVLALLAQFNVIQIPHIGIIPPDISRYCLYAVGGALIGVTAIPTMIHLVKVRQLAGYYKEYHDNPDAAYHPKIVVYYSLGENQTDHVLFKKFSNSEPS